VKENNDESLERTPVMCSKCNLTFESESDYVRHYNDKHRY